MKDDQFQQLQNWRHSQWDRCHIQIHFPEISFSYISPSSAYCRGSNSLRILGILRDHKSGSNLLGFLTIVIPFSQSDSIMISSMLYSFWGISYYTVISLVYILSFYVQMIVLFSMRLIQKVSSYLVSLWFSSPASVTFNLLCLSTKVLNPVASP